MIIHDNLTDPRVFGPLVWRFLHIMGLVYPHKPSESEQNNMRRFLLLLFSLMPCSNSVISTKVFLKSNPPQVASQNELHDWLNTLHNHVNARIGKMTCDNHTSMLYTIGQKTKSERNRTNGHIGPTVWGPPIWRYLHILALCYDPSTQKQDMTVFLPLMLEHLPCSVCRTHATTYAREHPPDLESTSSFHSWLNMFHNAVNQRLNKKRQSFTDEESKQHTLKLCSEQSLLKTHAHCGNNRTTVVLATVIPSLALLLIILLLFWRHRKHSKQQNNKIG